MYHCKWFTYQDGPIDGFNIRQTVFIREQQFDSEFDTYDLQAHHLVVYEDDVPFAVGRIIPYDGTCCKFGRIALLPAYRGRRLGLFVMQAMEEKAAALGYTRVHISSQKHAQGFYEKAGYRIVGEDYLEEGRVHIAMEKELSVN